MGILYCITMLLLFLALVFVKKTPKKINIINTCILLVILLLAYQVGVCFGLNAIGIPICLESLNLINFIIVSIIGYYILKQKKIQTYYFHKSDIIYVACITIIVLGVAYQNFGFPFQIKYETTDPYIHARAAVTFSETNTLLNKEKDGMIEFNNFIPGAYINAGIWMKVLDSHITGIDKYQVFIAFDITMFLLISLAMYTCLNQKGSVKCKNLIACILTILFTLGYPLNSMLFGFEYLSMAILVSIAILKIITLYHEKEILKKEMLISLFFFNITLFLSYFLFVPVVFMGLGIYFIIENYDATKKLITKELLLKCCLTLILPALWGTIYLILPRYVNPEIATLSNIAQLEGTIYRNWYSNIIILIPLCLYVISKETKQIHPATLFFISTLLCILLFMFLSNKGAFSTYYLAKLYYLAWVFIFYLNTKALQYLSEKNTYFPLILILIYVILLTTSFLCYKDKKMNMLQPQTYENITTIAEIYNANNMILKNQKKCYTYEEIQFLKQALPKVDFSKQVDIIGSPEHVLWAYTMTGQSNIKNTDEAFGRIGNEKNRLLWANNEKQDYIIYYKRSMMYQRYKKEIFNNRTLLFENNIGGVLIRNDIIE